MFNCEVFNEWKIFLSAVFVFFLVISPTPFFLLETVSFELRVHWQLTADLFGCCRSITSLSSENFGDGLKLDTTTSASETSSSMRVSLYHLAAGNFIQSCIWTLLRKSLQDRNFPNTIIAWLKNEWRCAWCLTDTLFFNMRKEFRKWKHHFCTTLFSDMIITLYSL